MTSQLAALLPVEDAVKRRPCLIGGWLFFGSSLICTRRRFRRRLASTAAMSRLRRLC